MTKHHIAIWLLAIPLAFSWDAPKTNTDGSPLTDLAGYRFYSGPKGAETFDTDIPGPTATFKKAYDFNGVKQNCFYVTAYNSVGIESAPSNELCLGKPSAPTVITVKAG